MNLLDALIGGVRKVYAAGTELTFRRGLDFTDMTITVASDRLLLAVAGLRGVAVSATTPVAGDVLAFDGTEWAPAPGGGLGAVSPVAAQRVVAGVAATPGWEVLGAFVYGGAAAKLQAMVLVSQGALTATVRLYGPIGGTPAEVTGSAITSSATTEVVIESADLTTNLTEGEIYQIQMECAGGALATDFAVARYAALVAA